ncbi:hypothetical protein EDC04DRAFT_778151 [Pisolithus marmoratus]|nr:hypothetical protein EDC04DRAFT_778151 [Pisolithus marmoratus]
MLVYIPRRCQLLHLLASTSPAEVVDVAPCHETWPCLRLVPMVRTTSNPPYECVSHCYLLWRIDLKKLRYAPVDSITRYGIECGAALTPLLPVTPLQQK